jgi:DNA-binding GntR family transcriptional regulator
MHISFTQGRSRAEREHTDIVKLCRKGDVPGACRALEEHIRNAGRAHRSSAAAKSRRRTTARKSAPDWSTQIET